MLRNNLLLTTAFVVASVLSCAPTFARPATAAISHDNNNEFLQTYSCGNGYFGVSGYLSDHGSTWLSSAWTDVAVPIIGQGKTIRSIAVKDGYTYASQDEFSVGIYSNTGNGLPGRLIAGGTATASARCGKITVPIAPTRLSRKTWYWVEETVPTPQGYSDGDAVYWELAPNSKHGAYNKHHFWQWNDGVTSSYTTPWTALKGAPWFKLNDTNRRR